MLPVEPGPEMDVSFYKELAMALFPFAMIATGWILAEAFRDLRNKRKQKNVDKDK